MCSLYRARRVNKFSALFCACLIFILLVAFNVHAQNPPNNHTRILYSHDLKSSDAIVQNLGGSFTTDGWKTTKGSSELLLELGDFLPYEGTMQVTLKGLMPNITDDWVPISLWSRGGGRFYEIAPTPGSYAFIKLDPGTVVGDEVYFSFWSCAFYDGYPGNVGREKTYPVAQRQWNPSTEYVFKFIWTSNRIWVTINNTVVVMHAAKWNGQVENFGYLFLGKDNSYGAMPGVTYKDLKIYGPATDYPFTDVSWSNGVMADRKIGGQGVSIADVNKDGYEDIFTAQFYNLGYQEANLLFVSQAQNQYQEEAGARGATGINTGDPIEQSYTYQGIFADFDVDGDQDLFTINFNGANQFLSNDGLGYFTDLSSQKIIGNKTRDSKGAVALDVENDGDYDVIVANGDQEHEVYIYDSQTNRFSFASRGLENYSGGGKKFKSVTAGDFNGDGYQDLALVAQSELLILTNNKSGFFSQAASHIIPLTANSASVGDIDNDGDLDILVALTAASAENDPKLEVFKNNGSGVFTSATTETNITLNSFGVSLGDWDNDGDPDIFATQRFSRPSKLFMNSGNGSFVEMPGTGAETQLADARGIANFDVDDDGDLDIYAVGRGSIEEEQDNPYNRNHLLRNDIVNANNYLKIVLLNDNDAPFGFGSKIYVYRAGGLGSPAQLIGFRGITSSTAFASQNSFIQHFGVGTNTLVDVKVVLPGGKEIVYTGQSVNRTITIRPSQLIPSSVGLIKGDGQSGKAGAVLGDSVTVRVRSTDNQPVPGHQVVFEVTAGGGALNGASTTVTQSTDQNGLARIAWKMGTVAGVQNTLTVSAMNGQDHLAGSPIILTVTPTANDPAVLIMVSGNNQEDYISQPLAAPLVVKVTDAYGNIISNFSVNFQVKQGGGTLNDGLTSVDVATDADGRAQVNWNLGAQPGIQQVAAQALFNNNHLTNSPLTFSATADQPALIISMVSGNHQTAEVVRLLSQPLVVKVEDFNQNPVAGETVVFKVVQGGGNFNGQSTTQVVTNQSGLASATPTLGTVSGDSNQVFHAEHSGAQGSPVIFKASATAGAAQRVLKVSGDNQSVVVNRTIGAPFVVRIVDLFNNGVVNFDVLFQVTEGSGTFNNGASSLTVKTDASGYASASLKTGQAVGTTTISATANGLQNSPVTFTVQTKPAAPAFLSRFSGDNQQGIPGQVLSQPFVAAVTDSFDNAIENHSLTFTVTAGGGNLNGQASALRTTNALGQASVSLTLGPTDFINQVAVTSQFLPPLIGNGAVFSASTGPGDPDSLAYISGNKQIGGIDAKLPEPLVVKVKDANGIALFGHDVTFWALTPGCHFSNNKTQITIQTSQEGLATTDAWIGSNIGDDLYEFEARATFNGLQLKGSPFTFTASGRLTSAQRIEYVSGNGISGAVGSTLKDAIQVKVVDRNNQPVANQPVVFTVKTGLSRLDGSRTTHQVSSGANGIAATSLTFGQTPGVTNIEAAAEDGQDPLEGSPIPFAVTALLGPPDANVSQITASKTSVIANGVDFADITVFVKDLFANPLSGQTVQFYTNSSDASLYQDGSLTNAEGKKTAKVISVKSGLVKIWAQIDGQAIPADTLKINFLPGPPAKTTVVNNFQFNFKGAILADSVGVQVRDALDNPTPGIMVTFKVKIGGGQIIGPDTVRTGSGGLATVRWKLGYASINHEQQLTATGVPGEPVTITAYDEVPPIKALEKVSGDSLISRTGQALPDSYIVVVKDTSNTPIPGVIVSWQIKEGSGTLNTYSSTTDSRGFAAALLTAGNTAGEVKAEASITVLSQTFRQTFTTMIENAPKLYLTKESQAPESARPQVDVPLLVRAADYFGRAATGDSLSFQTTQGNGSLINVQPVTDANGLARATWRLGSKGGTQIVEVKPRKKDGAPVSFSVNVINGPPALTVNPPDTIYYVEPDSTINFIIAATDPDGDAIQYGIINRPNGAIFDPTVPTAFTWKPTAAQINVYRVTFTATDVFGAADSMTIIIDVSTNAAPFLTDYSPLADTLVLKPNTRQDFMVRAYDPDNDPLSYSWSVNGELKSTTQDADSSTFPFFYTADDYPDTLEIAAVISDGKITIAIRRWVIIRDIEDSVELSYFEAVATQDAVTVRWAAAFESDNAGYNVFRARSRNGLFVKLNSLLIPPTDDWKYSFTDADVAAGEKYYYKIQDISRSGQLSEHGPIEASVPLPKEIVLQQNYPNPFNPTTTIHFELPEAGYVTLTVFNSNGQEVKPLVAGHVPAGVHKVAWDATNASGTRLPSGIYYYQLVAEDRVITKKLLLMK